MRTDVKLGIVSSMVIVLVVGGYFLFRGDSQAPIPIADKAAPANSKTASKPPLSKQPLNNPSRQVTSSKDAARTPSTSGRDSKVASKPPERPLEAPPKDRTPVTQPVGESVATIPNASLNKPTAPEPKADSPIVTPIKSSAIAERPADPPAPPTSSPTGTVSSPTTSREIDSGFTSRTLMAGNDPAKSVPKTPAESAPSNSLIASPAGTTPRSETTTDGKVDLGKAAVDTHRVQPGDSFTSLAQSYYGNSKYAKFLADSNPGVSDPARLALGTTIKIPPLPRDIETRKPTAASEKAVPSVTTAASGKRTYKVKSGDSFYRIAKDQLGNAERWRELLDLNKTVVNGDPSALQPGQTLVLPD